MSDATRELPSFAVRIKVMQEHISRGQPKSVDRCPIALAIIDALPVMDQDGDYFLSVGPRSVDVPLKVPGVGWALHRYRHFNSELPSSAQDFIKQLDAGSPPQPFEFDLTLEQEKAYV